MHRTCTNNPLKSDRRNWMTGQKNQCRWILSLSLLKATVPSDEIDRSSDCEDRTVDWNLLTPKFRGRFRCSIIHNRNWKPNDMPVLGLAGCHSEKWKIDAGTQSWSGSVSPRTDSVFVGQCLSVVHCPPAKLEVLHLYRWFTHTHQKEEKSPGKHKNLRGYLLCHLSFSIQTSLCCDIFAVNSLSPCLKAKPK